MVTNLAGATKKLGERQPASFAVIICCRLAGGSELSTLPSRSGSGWFGASFFCDILNLYVEILSGKFLTVDEHHKFITARLRHKNRVHGNRYVHFSQSFGKVDVADGGLGDIRIIVKRVRFHAQPVSANSVIELHEDHERACWAWNTPLTNRLNKMKKANRLRFVVLRDLLTNQQCLTMRQRFIRIRVHGFTFGWQ